MNVRIVVDSAADLLPIIRNQLTVVPMNILFNQEEYIDGVTINHRTFYEKLVESDVMPRTSQPSPEAFAQVFRQARACGEEVVVLTVSARLSGTYQSAVIAARDFDHVYVVDTKNVALGEGILAEMALRLAQEGLDARSIAHRLEEEREHVRLIAMLDTLEYLRRGGRISGAAAFAGGLLSIKPVIGTCDGAIEVIGKARGSRQGNNLLVKEIQQCGGVDFSRPVLLGYTGLSDALLQKYIADSAFLWENHMACLPQTIVGSVVGAHAGPGAVAVAFFRK